MEHLREDPTIVFAVRNIAKRYGVVKALDGVSMDIRAGEVHAVIGENGAGKSTLMNIICGRTQPTEGELYRNSKEVHFKSTFDAQSLGIAIAPQEINLVPHLSVSENILLGAQRCDKFGVILWKENSVIASEFLRAIDDEIDPNLAAKELSKAHQQLVQITRATATNADILIFDEPTAALTDKETEKLFRFIKEFKKKGGSVLYVSHRLDEVLALSDQITVLRDGQFVTNLDPKTTNKEAMVNAMAGRPVKANAHRAEPRKLGNVIFEVSNLTRAGEFHDISFELREKEILGVAGLIGAGRSEVGKCLFGVTKKDSGKVKIFGKEAEILHPSDAIKRGLVYLPEERKQDGIFPLFSITENTSIASYDLFKSLMGLNFSAMLKEAMNFLAKMKTKYGQPKDLITSLSGGNQQKVILARWLMRDSKILILDEPTRGIDVGAKLEIQSELKNLAQMNGLSIIYISSELQEVIDVADRIIVMHEGSIKGSVLAQEATQENLLALAMS